MPDEARLWAELRASLADRLHFIERATADWRADLLEEVERVEAEQAAEKLAGAFELLGRATGARAAWELSGLFRAEAPSSRGGAERSGELVAVLRQELAELATGARRVASADQALPVARSPSGLPDHDQSPAGQPARGRILLADDDASVARILEVALRLDGYELVHAETGTDAVRLAYQYPFDLILLDHRMPGLDGIAACRALRAASQTRNTPIVMLTGSADAETARAGFAEGVDDYITKPFRVAQVRARVRAWLMRRADRGQPAPSDSRK